jgi:hypothetical protein
MGTSMTTRIVATTMIMRMEMKRAMSIGTTGQSTMSHLCWSRWSVLRVVGGAAAGHRALSEALVHHQALWEPGMRDYYTAE